MQTDVNNPLHVLLNIPPFLFVYQRFRSIVSERISLEIFHNLEVLVSLIPSRCLSLFKEDTFRSTWTDGFLKFFLTRKHFSVHLFRLVLLLSGTSLEYQTPRLSEHIWTILLNHLRSFFYILLNRHQLYPLGTRAGQKHRLQFQLCSGKTRLLRIEFIKDRIYKPSMQAYNSIWENKTIAESRKSADYRE